MFRLAIGAALIGAFAGCGTYSESLRRAQQAVEEGEHERALAILVALEPDASRLTYTERARYDYLRGMTDYRVGDGAEARHWLALAWAYEQELPGTLPDEWDGRLGDALGDLNAKVYAGGVGSLTKGTQESAPDDTESFDAPDAGAQDETPATDASSNLDADANANANTNVNADVIAAVEGDP